MIAQRGRGYQAGTEKTHADMDVDERPFPVRQSSGVNEHQAWDCAKEQEDHSDANQGITLTQNKDRISQSSSQTEATTPATACSNTTPA